MQPMAPVMLFPLSLSRTHWLIEWQMAIGAEGLSRKSRLKAANWLSGECDWLNALRSIKPLEETKWRLQQSSVLSLALFGRMHLKKKKYSTMSPSLHCHRLSPFLRIQWPQVTFLNRRRSLSLSVSFFSLSCMKQVCRTWVYVTFLAWGLKRKLAKQL